MKNKIGGSFAPPLTDELLDRYDALAADAEPQVRDAMRELLACVRTWWDLPESEGGKKPHASGTGTIVELDAPIAATLDPVIPWADELSAYAARFDTLTPKSEISNAAFHLLWHVNELNLGREPITTDKL
jgi:hypothetical protein